MYSKAKERKDCVITISIDWQHTPMHVTIVLCTSIYYVSLFVKAFLAILVSCEPKSTTATRKYLNLVLSLSIESGHYGD